MATMRAAIYSGITEIGIRDVERAPPPPGYAVVEMKQAGICGSDLHSYYGKWGQSETHASGHETCGVVVEVGDGVTRVSEGDVVAIECFSHCGNCRFCNTGHYNHCDSRGGVHDGQHGGFSEYATAHESGLYVLPKSMSYEAGAMVEPLAVSYRAVALSGAGHLDRVAVVGGGTIGLLALAAAKAAGAETLITVKYPGQARVAEALGADHIVNVMDGDAVGAVRDITGGYGMDAVIETVGTARGFDDALGMARRQGKVVLVAAYFEQMPINLSRVVWSEVTVTGSNCYAYSGMKTDFEATIDLMSSGRVD
ncbi:alcohol dehydrogenase catalytic domain-containing protein, partial [Candidatus Poribacteria bacterium]|nr:alcohol dehydrogenase catalytic domain-containing protein [Candidatus Poribacteria bacterium]